MASNSKGSGDTNGEGQLLIRLGQVLQCPITGPPKFTTAHSVVYKAESHLYRGKIAIKVIDKKKLPPQISEKFLPRELEITAKVRHPHLARCLAVFQASPTKLVIVSEFYEKGNLLDILTKHGAIPELPTGLRYFRQLIEGVNYLHERNIVHRDIKLENILLDNSGDVKLIDFGFARFIARRERSRSFCGTRPYSSPQLIGYIPYDGYAADWYACGVVLYTMVVGKWPVRETIPNVYRPFISFPEGLPSMPCQRLIRILLESEENHRGGYDECINSEWMVAEPRWVFADHNFVYEKVEKRSRLPLISPKMEC